MTRPRARYEEWARQMVERALGMPVRQHDDGSAPRMYDLVASYADGRTVAIEVVSATDGEANALWKLVSGGGRLILPAISGGWMLQLRLDTRAERLLAALPEFLRVLEAQEQVEVDDDDFPLRPDVNARYARSLGIRWMRQSDTDFPGSVYFTIDLGFDRTGGAVADHSDALPAWLASWLAEPGQADVLSKLARSGCDERHACVLVPPFPTAPFDVTDLLMRDGVPLPSEWPELPDPVTHVWAVSGWRQGSGFRWSPGDGWATFDKLQPDNRRVTSSLSPRYGTERRRGSIARWLWCG